MTAEQIVRALAAADPIHIDADGDHECGLCVAPYPLASHDPDCPWRLAVEWVAADAAVRRLAATPDDEPDITTGLPPELRLPRP